MIEIKVRRENGFDIEIHGHSMLNPGNDIVCAAVSILGQTLAQKLWEMEAEGRLTRLKMSSVIPLSGELSMSAEPKACERERLEIVTDTIMTGFQMLSLSFPKNVKVTDPDVIRKYVPPDPS